MYIIWVLYSTISFILVECFHNVHVLCMYMCMYFNYVYCMN